MGCKPPPGSFMNLTPEQAADVGIKLRESCDSCLTAKVKCGKGRPVCHRCLTNGSDCQYSPSARAGRKHRSKGVSKPVPRKRPASIEIPSHAPGLPGLSPSPWTSQFVPSPQDYRIMDVDSNVPIDHPGTQAFMSHTPPLSNEDRQIDALNRDKKEATMQVNGGHDSGYQVPTPPTSGTKINPLSNGAEQFSASSTTAFPEFSSAVPSPTAGVHSTIDLDAWMTDERSRGMSLDHCPGPFDIMSFDDAFSLQPPFGSNPYENSSLDDVLLHFHGNEITESTPQQSQKIADGGQECDDCFARCLTALHSLHAHSWKTPAATQGMIPFDVILTINREAVRGCQAMMNCVNCSTKNGRPVSTMLLGTVFGKVMSLYRAAVKNRLDPSKDVQLAFGAYTALAEDRYLLETEILLFELKKVQRIIGQFQSKCRASGIGEDSNGVYEPQAIYLAGELGVIIDFLQKQKEHRSGDA